MKIPHCFRITIFFLAFITIVFSPLMASDCFSSASATQPDAALQAVNNIPPDVNQILLVTGNDFLFFKSMKVHALEKTDSGWRQAMDPIDATIGRNGFAPYGEKREGDGRTPSGLYRLGTAFGYAESAATKMPYRQSMPDDVWIDDPNAPDYNRWVRQSRTRALSFERMKRVDHLYQYGMVIEYNTDPVIKGHGSAIFLHIWAGPKSATAGCVAVSEDNLLGILSWLDPAAKPAILINPEPALKRKILR
jgi:L,D-peptidoglycan transpeptidase YkuD (ErfK/YbiS/YcfS/YnhG family)